jgi:hypothetical protein
LAAIGGLLTWLMGALPTAMVGCAVLPPKNLRDGIWRTHWSAEVLADLALLFSAVMVILVGGDLVAMILVKVWGHYELQNVWLMGFATLPLAIIYLAPRLLFLIEDYADPLAWVRILLVMLPLAKRIIFG